MLTLKQQQVYEFVKSFLTKHGYAPTTVEIAQAIGIQSRGVVHRYLRALEEANLLEMVPNKRRNLRLIHSSTHHQAIPLLGKIAAGKPIEAVTDNEEISLDDFLDDGRYALRVYGNSMIEEGILDGDLVICRHCQQASNGSIVVALIDNEYATLKRFQTNSDKSKVTLLPANADLLPMTYPAHRVQVQGVFVGLIRM